ncbi:hypothetical protein LTR04_006332 [Oleoguttula sp. CCFEE 6159]|nr:hypothetical protein LTR04_006332 [Oleoguttula sp. CCFEE 6159]
MSVRVVARIRPLLKLELDKDTIVEAATAGSETIGSPTIVRIPNPKNEAEAFSFQFNSVYDQKATQQQIFDNEVAPTVKHLFNGFDVTLFAYGVTGTGKTHTMRGGKTLAERGVIPRLLSGIYRRSRKTEKDTSGETQVQVTMSYYEIYNDRVYDLFEAPEKRTPAGLPIRDNGGKTVVVGLTERPCTTLKEFEQLYDQANLNAHSSRSHAILCVKVVQSTGDQTRINTASAIDLAGSEDNRRTDNGKERLVESASINKSLFVLAQCVEAISRKQARIPYRESKMTRILSLGQNNGITVMILNLAPVRSYHLDTLSSLSFANRTKKIEVNEVENEPFFRAAPKTMASTATTAGGPTLERQPLRPKMLSHNMLLNKASSDKADKPVKAFSVYSDKSRPVRPSVIAGPGRRAEPQKRPSTDSIPTLARPAKAMRPSDAACFSMPRAAEPSLSKASIEEMIERKVEEKLAARALNEPIQAPPKDISEEVQRRLDLLEQRIEKKEDGRAEGLQYLLMAKQHQVRGEDASALRMYQLALPFFPDNEKLGSKMLALQEKIRARRDAPPALAPSIATAPIVPTSSVQAKSLKTRMQEAEKADDEYVAPPEAMDVNDNDEEVDSFLFESKRQKTYKRNVHVFRDESTARHSNIQPHIDESTDELVAPASTADEPSQQTPRTQNLLRIINTRDLAQIRLLKGVGAKKAEAIINTLCAMDDGDEEGFVRDLEQLGKLRGVGVKTVENMRTGLSAGVYSGVFGDLET